MTGIEHTDSVTPLRLLLVEDSDAVLSDFSLPGLDGMDVLKAFQGAQPHTPVIIVSGVLGQERAVEIMRAGARDCVIKQNIDRLEPVLERELAEARIRRQRSAALRALEAEQRRYRGIFELSAVALIEVDLSSLAPLYERFAATRRIDAFDPDDPLLHRAARAARVVSANDAAFRLLGRGPDEILGTIDSALEPGSVAAWSDMLAALAATPGSVFQKEVEVESPKGRIIEVLFAFRIPASPADLQNIVVGLLDVGERNSLERQMRAAQRMESLGRLASGIVHDFNNVLTVISGNTEFLLDDKPPSHPDRAELSVIQDAVARSERLIGQLLAFSRRQHSEPRVVDLNAMVRDLERLLRRVIGADVQVRTRLADDVAPIEVDPTHVDQVVMNLAINARDAMPHGGRLEIATSNVAVEEDERDNLAELMPAGEYVELRVTDDGQGMDERTRMRVFEPFFTTKSEAEGTGLGLSTVYGIVRQAGGFVRVDSELGHGTTFRVFFPPSESTGDAAAADPRASPPPGGTETVLLVEDDADVRVTAMRVLQRAGYTVLAVRDAAEALQTARVFDGLIHAVVSDVVMPGMNGPELVVRLSALLPGLRVLYMSGYGNEELVRRRAEDRHGYVPKPFTAAALLTSLRDVLD